MYDVIIAGGGPAGLSAALILGRCLRKVLIVDSGKPRNASSRSMHAYLTRDGMDPAEFLKSAREEVLRYPTVEFRCGTITDARKQGEQFSATIDSEYEVCSRKLLLAGGVVDDIPALENIDQFYGVSVHHCPYCDGYEWKDAAVAVYGNQASAALFACELTAWTRNLTFCTDGLDEFDEEFLKKLHSLKVAVNKQRIVRLEGKDAKLEAIVFNDGSTLRVSAMFFSTGQRLHTDLAERLGCKMTEKGAVWTGDCEATDVSGLYCAGDASKNAQFVIVAASEGAQAGASINKALTWENIERV